LALTKCRGRGNLSRIWDAGQHLLSAAQISRDNPPRYSAIAAHIIAHARVEFFKIIIEQQF
jgi:hypothetical protein